MIYNRSRYPRIAAVFRSMKKQQHPLSGKPGPPNKRWCGMFCYPAVLVFVPGAYRRRAVPGRLRASGPQGCNSFPCGRLRPLRAPCATYSVSFFCCRPPWGGTGSAPGFWSAGLPPFSLRTPAAPPRPLRNVQRQFFLLPPAVGNSSIIPPGCKPSVLFRTGQTGLTLSAGCCARSVPSGAAFRRFDRAAVCQRFYSAGFQIPLSAPAAAFCGKFL